MTTTAGVEPTFLADEVLLSTATARSLYHEVAEACPIVDVHNHLPPREVAEDRVWTDLADLWLGDDHYKWRAMRQAGVDEALITGEADPWDRFQAWAATMPLLVRNPLYLWTHLELRRVFGIDLILGPDTAREIWDEANRQLPDWSAQRLLAHFRVTAVATTDDPADDLAYHEALRRRPATGRLAMVPTLRPDRAHRLLHDPSAWHEWAEQLGAANGVRVTDLDSMLDAVARSWRRMVELGGRASDHGLRHLPDRRRDERVAAAAIRTVLGGVVPAPDGRDAVLLEVVSLAARLAHGDDAVLQLHLGPQRDASPRLHATVGTDAGGDAVGDDRQGPGLVRFLADLERDGALPRTVLYNANPADNALFATLATAFSRPGCRGLVQWGPPWWFNDHEEGLRRHLDDLSDVGALGTFVGMLTDSRSFLSMTRHELFRRILCDVVGRDVEAGRLPADRGLLDGLVRDLCVSNAVTYFGFPADWARWP